MERHIEKEIKRRKALQLRNTSVHRNKYCCCPALSPLQMLFVPVGAVLYRVPKSSKSFSGVELLELGTVEPI